MLKKYVLFLKRSPIITAILCIVYVIVCFKTVESETNFHFFIVRTMLCGAVCFFLYQISGEKTLMACYNSTGFVLKNSMGFLILSFLFGSILLIAAIQEGRPLLEHPIREFIIVFFMYIAVGLFEELSFRAVINDAIIYKFRNWKYVFVLSAVVSSIAFGAAHVIGFDISSSLAWAQAIGKTLESGVFGLALLILYWKTRNIWACGVSHGLFDFFTDFTSGIFVPDETATSYVSTEYGMQSVIIYGVLTVISTIFTLIIWKKVGKTIDFDEIRRSW